MQDSRNHDSTGAAWGRLGRVGVWSTELRFGDPGQVAEAAAELEELGYGAIWIPGGHGGDLFGAVETLLNATRHLTVATGILNIWKHTPAETAAWWRSIGPALQARTMLGLGVSHAMVIGEAYAKPLQAMKDYLDGLDAEGVPTAARCLAALGPRMLDLSRDRSAGAHPYLATARHTAEARQRLGPGALLAPEQGVILESDPGKARQKAREQLATYARLPNYADNWRRLGFSEDDVSGLSDRLVDGLFAWGGPEQIARGLSAHLEAGADHVCLQVISGPAGTGDLGAVRQVWRDLAPSAIPTA